MSHARTHPQSGETEVPLIRIPPHFPFQHIVAMFLCRCLFCNAKILRLQQNARGQQQQQQKQQQQQHHQVRRRRSSNSNNGGHNGGGILWRRHHLGSVSSDLSSDGEAEMMTGAAAAAAAAAGAMPASPSNLSFGSGISSVSSGGSSYRSTSASRSSFSFEAFSNFQNVNLISKSQLTRTMVSKTLTISVQLRVCSTYVLFNS